MDLLEVQTENRRAGVSVSLVKKIGEAYPHLFCDRRGKVVISKVLFALGFKIKAHQPDSTLSYVRSNNKLIRNQARPYEVYRSDIFTGTIRNEVSHIDELGNIKYTRQRHWLGSFYDAHEVLTDEHEAALFEMIDINTVGSIDKYNYGMQVLNQPADSSKVKRNIVRD